MCGRFTLTIEAAELQRELNLEEMPSEWRRRFNIAPTQPVIIVSNNHPRQAEWMRWGLVPSWAKDISIGNRLINARAETLTEKPSFRQALAKRRCIIPADGFFEWQHWGSARSAKQPFYFRLKNQRPFVFAGLWETWQPQDGTTLFTCTIITCAANSLVGQIHERMPVILSPEDRQSWLDNSPATVYKNLLVPYPAEEMEAYPVGTLVNSPANDDQACISPKS